MDPHAFTQFRDLERTHWWFRGRRTVYLGLLRHHLAGERPDRVLDVGSGMGGFLDGLQTIGERIHPNDTSPEALAHCKTRGFTRGARGSAYALPYAPESFDLVCLFDVIEHLDDDTRALQEATRVLRPGGHLLLTVPAYPFLYANNDRVAHHRRRYTRRMLRDLFARTGLQEERNTHANVLLLAPIVLLVLTIKCIEALFLRKRRSRHTNLSWPLPGVLHSVLYGVFASELLVSRHVDLPIGHSIAAIARKPGAQRTAKNAKDAKKAPRRRWRSDASGTEREERDGILPVTPAAKRPERGT